MSSANSSIKRRQSGFTIVELLIVIVIIAILAAITIVSYSGITAQANRSSAQSAASNFAKKAEIYYADQDNTTYPATATAMTGAASTETYYLSGVNVTYGVTPLTSSAANNAVRVLKCASGAATTQAAITATSTGINSLVGLKVYYFDYVAGTETTTPMSVGNTTNCPTAA